jgi:hypothetical protein
MPFERRLRRRGPNPAFQRHRGGDDATGDVKVMTRDAQEISKERDMHDLTLDMAPGTLDGWLRERLARSLVLVGITLGQVDGAVHTGEPPRAFTRAMEDYTEIWLRWLAVDTTLDGLVLHAVTREADALLIWLPASPETPVTVAPAWPERALRELLGARDGLKQRERCVLALLGPDASPRLAHDVGCDVGFGPEISIAHIATVLAREAAGRGPNRRRSSSLPHYL